MDEAGPDTLDRAAIVKVDELAILRRPDWQMTFGERAAFEGLVAQVAPELAIEVGSAAGGSLERIAAHSKEVHAIDLTGVDLARCPANVSFHEGDSKVILADLLARLAAEGRNVDFIHLDGDHTAVGIRADIEPLLASSAVRHSLILIHDSFNPEVRAGIESLRLPKHPKVRGFDLDFVPGRLGRVAAFEDVGLGGFAAVILDEPASGRDGQDAIDLGFWSWNPTPFLVHDAYASSRRLAQLTDARTLGDAASQVLEGESLKAAERRRHGATSSTPPARKSFPQRLRRIVQGREDPKSGGPRP
jgi:hypothetical protein